MHRLVRASSQEEFQDSSVDRHFRPAAPSLPSPERDPGAALTLIEPSTGWSSLKLGELWTYREVIYFLTWRDVKVRYKQTVLGITWAVIQPLFTMLVFSFFFGRLAKVPSDGIPYPLFSLTALIPWTLFANGMTQSSNSFAGNSNLLSKVYFPRLAVPVSAVLPGAIDFWISFALLLMLMPVFRVFPSGRLLLLPAFFSLALLISLGAGVWLAALSAEYRDVRHTIPFLTQLWMFGTPIAYPYSLLHGSWRILYALNPMVGVVEGFRWAVLGAKSQPGGEILVSVAAALFLPITGALYFRRMERTFIDVI
jgi:lipopolysaccharide transport system permease protein